MDRKKAYGYIRVVTDERDVIDEQKRNIENAVFKAGYVLKEIYIDTGSGASLEREGIKKLLHDIQANPVDAVFIGSTEVLSTDNMNTSEFLEMMTTLNTRVYSVQDEGFLNAPLDTLNNLSRKIYNTLTEMERNGVELSNAAEGNNSRIENDPTLRLQNKIIEAYLNMGAENRPQV